MTPDTAAVERVDEAVRAAWRAARGPLVGGGDGQTYTVPQLSQDVMRQIVRAVLIALSDGDLFHTTGERITRKDLNNAFRLGAEQGRLAAHVVDGLALSPPEGEADHIVEANKKIGEAPKGWRLVPVEPTAEMMGGAGALALNRYVGTDPHDSYHGTATWAAECYAAMLSVAPVPPLGQAIAPGAIAERG